MNLTMVKFTQKELDEINPTLKTAQDALTWASENLHPKLQKHQALEQKILFWLI